MSGLFLMLVLEKDDPELYPKIQEKNLIRQYDLLTNDIEIGLKQGPASFDKYCKISFATRRHLR